MYVLFRNAVRLTLPHSFLLLRRPLLRILFSPHPLTLHHFLFPQIPAFSSVSHPLTVLSSLLIPSFAFFSFSYLVMLLSFSSVIPSLTQSTLSLPFSFLLVPTHSLFLIFSPLPYPLTPLPSSRLPPSSFVLESVYFTRPWRKCVQIRRRVLITCEVYSLTHEPSLSSRRKDAKQVQSRGLNEQREEEAKGAEEAKGERGGC